MTLDYNGAYAISDDGTYVCAMCGVTSRVVRIPNKKGDDIFRCPSCLMTSILNEEVRITTHCNEWGCRSAPDFCEEHAHQEASCMSCGGQGDSVYCIDCAPSEWDMHFDGDCETPEPECEECYRTAENRFCYAHMQRHDDDVRAEFEASMKTSVATAKAAQEVRTEDGQIFHTEDGIVINFGG